MEITKEFVDKLDSIYRNQDIKEFRVGACQVLNALYKRLAQKQ